MANRVPAPNLFAPVSPNWSLAQLDQNSQNATGAINDSSLGSVNGPLADTGSVNAYAVTCALGAPSAYNNGMTVFFNPAATNTGASTLTVSPLSSLPIVSATGSALVGGEIVANNTTGVVCDGSAFRIFSVPATSLITSVRLRSINTLGNPGFEVDQRHCGSVVTNANSFIVDRWACFKSGTMQVSAQQIGLNSVVPNTDVVISQSALRVTVTTTEASLGASDQLIITQYVEGPFWRELQGAHSISLLVRSSVAGLKFGVSLQDSPTTKSLTLLGTIPSANTETLITFPGLPIFPAGNFSVSPGVVGYQFTICLAAGATVTSPANGTWQTAVYTGASGQSNFVATSGATFDVAFVQHEPNGVATTLMEKRYVEALEEAKRYYCKSYSYGTIAGFATTTAQMFSTMMPVGWGSVWGAFRFPRTMAKAPAVTAYSPNTGTVNKVRDALNGTDITVTSTTDIGDHGFDGFGITGQAGTGNIIYAFHYIADTSW